MNLTHLYNEQRKLDQRIYDEKKIEPSQELTDLRIIAFKVEVGELANEIRFFKFWSNKPTDFDKALEELVDCIHFLLGIGLDRNYYKYVSDASGEHYKDFTFQQLFYDLLDNPIDCTASFEVALNTVLGIGLKLGFTEEEMKLAYFKKNEKNHVRQDEGY